MLEKTKFMRTKTGKCSRGEFLHTPLNMPQTEYPWEKLCPSSPTTTWVLTIWQKNLVGCQKHNGKRFTSLPQNFHIHYRLNPKKGRICVAWVWNWEVGKLMVSNIPFGLYQPKWRDYLKMCSSIFGLKSDPIYHLPSFPQGFPKFSVKR